MIYLHDNQEVTKEKFQSKKQQLNTVLSKGKALKSKANSKYRI